MPSTLPNRADRALERALLFNFLIHGVALIAMAALLLPALPGGWAPSDADRIATIAEHPWRFRIGWVPWQLCAVADLLLAVAMVRTSWLPCIPTALVLLLTLIGVVPDQYAQALWVTRGVDLARSDPTAYLAFERDIFPLTAGYGAVFATLAALGWTWCFARAGTWSRPLTWLSVPLSITMLMAAVSPLLPAAHRPGPGFVSVANGLAFLQFQIWLGLVTEAVFLRARPYEPFGRLARWRHPGSSITSRFADAFANSRVIRVLLEWLPALEVRSDITDVVYVNYLVRVDAVASIVPPGLELQRLGPNGQYALFSFLTYRHGHFGFAFLGPLRRWLPSPVQTNWRIHVKDPRTGHAGSYFLTNATTHLVPALGARMLTEGMPMHVLHRAVMTRSTSGELHVVLDPGKGSAPDAEMSLRPTSAPPALEGAWAACWPDFRAFLAYCVPQDRAMSSQPLRQRITRQEIDLGIPLDACEPLEGNVVSRAAHAIVGDESPICFRVPRVDFVFSTEVHDRCALAFRSSP